MFQIIDLDKFNIPQSLHDSIMNKLYHKSGHSSNRIEHNHREKRKAGETFRFPLKIFYLGNILKMQNITSEC